MAKGPALASVGFNRRRTALAAVLLAVIGGAVYYTVMQLWRDPIYQIAQEAIARRDFAEAGRILEMRLGTRPDDQEIRLLAARTARRRGDWGAARGHLLACEQRGLTNADMALEHRLLLLQQGDMAETDALLEKCAKNPHAESTPLMLEAVIEGSINVLSAMFQREAAGKGQMSASDHARTQRAVNDWLDLRPGQADQVQGYIWRGKLYSLARDNAKAQLAFRRALELDPGHIVARESLAIVLSGAAPEESAAHLQLLHQHDRKNMRVTVLLADVYRTLGKLDQATQLLQELLAEAPNHVPALIMRGQIALDQGRPNEAETWLRRALSLAPHQPEVKLLLSQCS